LCPCDAGRDEVARQALRSRSSYPECLDRIVLGGTNPVVDKRPSVSTNRSALEFVPQLRLHGRGPGEGHRRRSLVPSVRDPVLAESRRAGLPIIVGDGQLLHHAQFPTQDSPREGNGRFCSREAVQEVSPVSTAVVFPSAGRLERFHRVGVARFVDVEDSTARGLDRTVGLLPLDVVSRHPCRRGSAIMLATTAEHWVLRCRDRPPSADGFGHSAHVRAIGGRRPNW
jgi:hypothetical protein